MPTLEEKVTLALEQEFNQRKIKLIESLCQEVAEDGYGLFLSTALRPYVDGKRV